MLNVSYLTERIMNQNGNGHRSVNLESVFVGYVLFTTVNISLVLIKIKYVIVKMEWPIDGSLYGVK
jgi:hypothetical protein